MQAIRAAAQKRVLLFPWGQDRGAIHAIRETLKRLGFEIDEIERGKEIGPGKIIAPGKGTWKEEVIRAIKERKPALAITFQRLYPGWGEEVADAIREYEIPFLCMDFGVWPHYDSVMVDPQGDNGASTMVGAFDALEKSPKARAAADRATAKVQQMEGHLRQAAEKAKGTVENLGLTQWEGAILLCLQRTGDSVLRYDCESKRSDMARVARETAAEAKLAGKRLIVKPHPLDGKCDLSALRGQKDVMVLPPALPENEGVLAWLLLHCKHLVTVNSTVTWQALALGVPTVMLGKNALSGNRVVSEFRSIKGAVAGPKPQERERGRRFLAHALSRNLTIAECRDVNRVKECLGQFYQLWDRQPPPAIRQVATTTAVSRPSVTGVHMTTLDRRWEWARHNDVRISQLESELAAVFAALEARPNRPKTFLEIGSQYGGTLWCYGGLVQPGGRIVSVDLEFAGRTRKSDGKVKARRGKVGRALRDEGKDVVLISADSHVRSTVAQVRNLFPNGIDLIHIDGDHSAKGAWADYRNYVVPMLAPGGVALFHDICHYRHGCEVAEIWKTLRFEHLTREFIEKPQAAGIGMILKDGRPETPRGAVYTAVFGGKEKRIFAPHVVERGIDYHAFTDDPRLVVSPPYHKHVVKAKYANPILASKIYKVFPWNSLPEYQWSLYHDGSLSPRTRIRPLIKGLPIDSAGVFFRFEDGASVHGEAVKNVRLNRVDAERQARLMHIVDASGYMGAGYMYFGGMILRRHTDATLRRAMTHWWELIEAYGPRDQIALNYCLWLFNLRFTIASVSEFVRRRSRHAINSNGQWRKYSSLGLQPVK
jgi:predicted O-methyltransferase YrrM